MDCHHLILQNSQIRKAVFDIAKKYNLPLRNEAEFSVASKSEYGNIKTPDVLIYDFTIENVTLSKIKDIIKQYGQKDVVVEIMCHPGYVDEETKKLTSYLGREKELEILKTAKECGCFDNVELISFGDIK